VQHTAELLLWQVTLAQDIVILEELQKSDSILRQHVLNLEGEGRFTLDSSEVDVSWHVCRLDTRGGSVDNVLEAVGVTQEFGVPDLPNFVAVNDSDKSDLFLGEREAERVKHLSENLLANLVVAMQVEVLEEALGIKSVLADHFLEALHDLADLLSGVITSSDSSVFRGSVDGIQVDIQFLLEALLGEYFINLVAEISPADMVTCFRGLEVACQHFVFSVRDLAFGHVESNSELTLGDVTASELVEVAEELSDPDSLLFAKLSDASDYIFDILWGVADDFSLASASLGLGEVFETVVKVSADAEEHLFVVNVFTEVDIVYLVEVTLVHVSTEEHLSDVIWSRNPEQVEHTEELGLGHMAILRDIEVLEDRLQVNSHVADSLAVLVQQRLDLVLS